jgi:hypothetical protein
MMVSRPKRKDTITLGFLLSADPVRAAFQRLARVLGDPDVIGSAIAELEPLAPLIARNAEHRVELLEASGGTLTADEVGALLGISRQAVDKRRRARGLLGLRQGGDWRYPVCQFAIPLHDVVAGLPNLLRAFSEAGPWATLDFLLAADETLGGRTPLEALRAEGWTGSLDRLVRIERGDGFG